MKKISFIFAILLLFMLQFSVVKAIDVNVLDTETSTELEGIDLDENKYSNLETNFYSCGTDFITHIPKYVPKIINIVYLIIQVAVPIILVIIGMINLLKAITASKEEDMKKAQTLFLKQLVYGALVFFLFVLGKLVISIAADASDKPDIIDCTNCFINGEKYCKAEK